MTGHSKFQSDGIYIVSSFKDFLFCHFHQNFTPQKLNIDIKNYGLEDDGRCSSFQLPPIGYPCEVSGG